MDEGLPKFVDGQGACRFVNSLGDVFALVKNAPYIFPPYEIYPLAPPRTVLEDGLEAVVMDMDGTTTTTEALCIESLATLVACMTGRGKEGAHAALNPQQDYPHIIGNSTTRHVEYLMRRYRHDLVPEDFCMHFVRSAAWNIVCGMDKKRVQEAMTALVVQGIGSICDAPEFSELCAGLTARADQQMQPLLERLTAAYFPRLVMRDTADLIRIGIEIYYQHYHELLKEMGSAKSNKAIQHRRLIEPMPAIGVALALLKGWLGHEAGLLAKRVAALLPAETLPSAVPEVSMHLLSRLGAYFEAHPVKIALVTSSIAAEADLVLREVFRALVVEARNWEVSKGARERIAAGFADPTAFYEARITADDSSEIRLKPHRDLYSIALHALGVPPDRFHRVAGFEDSESGTIAIRAAGIPLSCALPFSMTKDHLFEAATQVCPCGMPEVMLLKHFFLPDSLL